MELPILPRQEFERRWREAQEAMQTMRLDVLLAYGDDHAVFGPAHVRYLANFPVHFEPACVVMRPAGEPALATGPETAAHAALVTPLTRIATIEEFALPGEEYPYLDMTSLRALITDVGAKTLRRIGVAGFDQMAVDT